MQKQICEICSSDNVFTVNTKVSRFLAEYIFKNDRKATNLYWCKDCGFSFYELRLSDEEITSLYKDYRGENYQKTRQKHDIWYTKKINELLGSKECGILNRNKNLARIIDSTISSTKIKSVLDFGGDKGQCFPENLSHCLKYIYDISGVDTESGVISLSSLKECKEYEYSIIMCNHVLEHVNDPLEVVNQIKELMNDDTHLYIELPFDSPFYPDKFKNLKFLFNRYFSWLILFKHLINTKKDRVFAPMNEHINYFTLDSARILLEKAGYKVVFAEKKAIDCGWDKTKMLCIMAKKA